MATARAARTRTNTEERRGSRAQPTASQGDARGRRRRPLDLAATARRSSAHARPGSHTRSAVSQGRQPSASARDVQPTKRMHVRSGRRLDRHFDSSHSANVRYGESHRSGTDASAAATGRNSSTIVTISLSPDTLAAPQSIHTYDNREKRFVERRHPTTDPVPVQLGGATLRPRMRHSPVAFLARHTAVRKWSERRHSVNRTVDFSASSDVGTAKARSDYFETPRGVTESTPQRLRIGPRGTAGRGRREEQISGSIARR